MLSPAANHFFAIVLLALATSTPGVASANRSETGESVVSRLYKDFGWQAIVGIQDIFGPTLARQNKVVLRRYFDPTLASLLVRDARCAAKTHQICNLDFDPIFASQDAGAADLTVTSIGRGKVAVEFKYPSNNEIVRLEYRLIQIAGKWKVSDVIYRSQKDASLKKLLMNKLPSFDDESAPSNSRAPTSSGVPR